MKRALAVLALAGLVVGGIAAIGTALAASKKPTKSEMVSQGVLYTEPKEGQKTFDGNKFEGFFVFQQYNENKKKWQNYGGKEFDNYNGFGGENGGVIYWPDRPYPTREGDKCRMLGKGPVGNDDWAPSKDTVGVKCSTGQQK